LDTNKFENCIEKLCRKNKREKKGKIKNNKKGL
jgi:hypothetical protein